MPDHTKQDKAEKVRTIRREISGMLHEINGARIERGLCIRQDRRLTILSHQVVQGFTRLAHLDPERASWYRECAGVVVRSREQQPAKLQAVA